MCYSYPQILYVDSDSDSCEIVRMMLQQADGSYEITTLNSADEAVELLSQRAFDLYIFDQPWRQPSGLSLCRKVREKDGKTPILIFSVMSRDSDREKAMAAGANVYLIKVDDIDLLTTTVKRLLDGDGVAAAH
ncbi:MAG TPA: response regulator [Pyrinomonadaceae bacterium]|jgi:DNA-binding response OmpR family regulator|nr:response regulator [Pyrinomonadaceae bacterium]